MATMSMDGMTMAPSSTDMPMASATPSGMSGMDSHSSTAMMGMNEMAMTFFTSTSTPLFSNAWTPDSTGKYAGACIFLILLSAIFRGLLAVRFNLFEIMATVKRRRGDDHLALYATDKRAANRPWRAGEAVMLASMDVVIGGVGYLLMIGVMTMNVGYFLSILAGIFVGSMAFAHYMARSVG